MTARVYVNNYTSTLFAAITDIATSCIVNSATGLPTLSGTDYYYLTLDNLLGTEEIVKVTARAGTTLTIVRGQEGTTGVAWAADSAIEMRATRTSFVSEPGTAGNTCVSDGTSWISVPTGSVNSYTTTATAAGTTTLTVASTFLQFFTGVTTQNCDLPVTSTLTLGHSFEIVNNSTGIVTVRSSGANTIIAIPADCRVVVNCILTSGTSASSWDFYLVPNSTTATGTGDLVRSTSPALITPALGTPTSGVLTNCTGLPVAGGGTGVASTTAYGVVCGGTTSTSALQSVAVGTANQALVSAGAGALPSMRSISQTVYSQTGATAAVTTQIPLDDTIPQNTEGDQILTVSITPTNTSNILVIEVCANFLWGAAGSAVLALFQDSTADALVATRTSVSNANNSSPTTLSYTMTAGTTSSTTFNVRLGPATAITLTLNGASGARQLGGVFGTFLRIREVIA